jgi:pyridoxamine 5'-phosphate oxidase
MTQNDVMNELDVIIDEAKTAVLASADSEGSPHMRWMTPTLLKDRKYAIYAITSKGFDKAGQLEDNPSVEWMFQTPQLDRVVNVRGKVNLMENPSLRSEVLEAIGARLGAFWKLKSDESSLLVLETVIESARFFKPMQGVRVDVSFSS